ncbi:hypothetical protein ACFQYP_49935 [Nonomuraea antimicrobica]
MAETPDEPTYQRLGPVNWLPEERKLVERFETEVRELRRRLEIAEAKAAYATWKLEATQAKRTFKLGEALGAKSPGKIVEAVRSRRRRPSRPPPSPRRSRRRTTGRRWWRCRRSSGRAAR